MSALNQGGLQVWLRRAVWLLLLGSFGCIFLVIALRGHWSLGSRKLLFCALLAAGVFLLRRFLPLVDRLTPGRWRAVFGGGLVLLFALQLGSGFLLLQDLTTSPFDTEAVLRTATELAQGTVPALYNDYFASVDTNVLCMFVLYWMYRPVYLLTGSTGPAWAMGLNTLFLFVAAVCVCGTAGHLWGRRGKAAALILCLLFLPYYAFTSFVYTDTMAAPLVVGSLWGFLALEGRWNRLSLRTRLLSCIGLGFLVGTAFLMKGNALLLYPAFVVYLALRPGFWAALRRCWRSALATVLLFCMGSVAVVFGFNAYKWNCGLLDLSLYESMHTPITHWIMMGLENDGAFSNDSYAYTGRFSTIEEKKAANLARIQTNLKHLLSSPQSLAWLFFTKAETDWGDGLYTAPQTVNLAPVQRTWLHEWLSVDGIHSDVTADFGQAFYWMLWAGAFIAAIRGIRNRRQPGESGLFLCAICLLGNLSFLTLWEANARYPFCYSCCLLLFGVSLLAAPHSEIQSA